MFWDDFTTSKLAPDNYTEIPEPPNIVEEAKDKGVVNLVDILSAKMMNSNKKHSNHSKTVWPRDVAWS